MHERLAARASHAGPDNAVHDEPTGDVFQFLRHILADPAQLAAAGAFRARRKHFLEAWQFWRQRLALRLGFLLSGIFVIWRGNLCYRRFLFLQLELQIELLGGLGLCAKPVTTMASELMLKLGDLESLRLG